jgi:hypothetical protein
MRHQFRPRPPAQCQRQSRDVSGSGQAEPNAFRRGIPSRWADRLVGGTTLRRLARWSSGLLFSLLLSPLSFADAPRAVSTFESIGVYWLIGGPPANSDDVDCRIEFRIKGTDKWREGLPLWHDNRNGEYRGSLVGLRPGTTYEIRLTINNGLSQTLEASTWREIFPIAKTVHLPAFSGQTLRITQSATSSGYILYKPAPGKSATIDVGKSKDFNIVVNAKYVIIRGLTLKGREAFGYPAGSFCRRELVRRLRHRDRKQ